MSDENAKGPEVFAAIGRITGALAAAGIAKNGKNQQQGYSFRGIEQVYAALAPLLVEHQLAVVPVVEERIETARPTQRGGTLYAVAMRVRFMLTSAVDGSSVEATVWGEGMDSADKATNKAMSTAYKYMAFMTFCIPVEGMVDSEADARTRTAAAPPQPKLQPYDLIEQAISDIGQAKTPAALNAIGKRVGASSFSKGDMDELKQAYQDQQETLGIGRATKEQTA